MYLDFGGALAAIGLVFAVYQLRRPIWDVVLRLRPWWQRNMFLILAIAGAILTLIAVGLDRFQPCWEPRWLFTSFLYQVLAYLAFAASPTMLLLLATSPGGLFTDRNAANFYRVLGWNLATTDQQNAVLNVLLVNFNAVCKTAVGPEKESRRYARAVLDVILSDDGLVKELTTKRLAGLQHVLDTAAQCGLSRHNSPIGIPTLVRNLYRDSSSFLYKQYEAEGLSRAINIYETLFGSARLLSNFELFESPAIDYTMRPKIGADGIEIFIEALTRSIQTYLTSGEVPPERINRGLEYLSEIFGDQCLQVSHDNRGEGTHPRTPAWETIGKISRFLGHDCIFFADRQTWNPVIRQMESAADDDGFSSRQSIAASFAEAMCNAFSQLAIISKKVDITWTYYTVIQLLHGIMYGGDSLSSDYRRPFTDGIWKLIHENVVRRFFPATLRVYLEYMGFLLIFQSANQGDWVEGEKERVRRLLYVDLKPLFDAGAKMINDEPMQDALLPQAMLYEKGKFYYTDRFGAGNASEIAEPPAGSSSALEGVKDQFDAGYGNT